MVKAGTGPKALKPLRTDPRRQGINPPGSMIRGTFNWKPSKRAKARQPKKESDK